MTNRMRTRPAGVASAVPRGGRQVARSGPQLVDEATRLRPDEVPTAAGQAPDHRSVAVNRRAAGPATAIALVRQQGPDDVVPSIRPDRRMAEDILSGPAAAERPALLAHGLPMPHLTGPPRETSVYYAVTTVDARGRLADASPLRILQWAPGLRITLMLTLGIVAAAAHPGGREAVTSQGHLRLPADLRHALRLNPGDRLLVAAHANRGLLVAYTMPALDEMVSGFHSSLAAGASSA